MPRGRDLGTLRHLAGLWAVLGLGIFPGHPQHPLSSLIWGFPAPMAAPSPSQDLSQPVVPAAPRLSHSGQGDVPGISFSSRPLRLSLPFTPQPRMLLPLSLGQHPALPSPRSSQSQGYLQGHSSSPIPEPAAGCPPAQAPLRCSFLSPSFLPIPPAASHTRLQPEAAAAVKSQPEHSQAGRVTSEREQIRPRRC